MTTTTTTIDERHTLLLGLVRRIARVPEARAALVLRGGVATRAWLEGHVPRATRDLDVVGDFAFDRAATRALFERALAAAVDDGCTYGGLADAVIWGHTAFPGVRLRLRAGLGKLHDEITVDVGFGDPLVPAPTELLGMRAVRPETQLAWKLHALAEMRAQFRPKDIADGLLITRHVPLVDADLAPAIAAAFTSRGFALGDARATLLAAHWATKPSRLRWEPYRTALGDLAPAVAAITARLTPVLEIP